MIHRLAIAAGACILLAACAGSPPAEEPAIRGRINVFISPMGEPFRGGETDAYPLDRWFARADADHDGALSWDEFRADAEAFFRQLDTNHDGVIGGAEVSAYEQDVAPEILPRVVRLTARDIPPLPSSDPETNRQREEIAANAAANGQETRPRAGLLAGAAVFGVTPEPEPVAASDTDFDGKITLAEWIQSARRRFDLLDKDHDGRITRAELPKTPAEKMAEKAERRDRREGHRGQ